MTAAMLVLEPIFEADLPSNSTPTDPGKKRSTGGGRGGKNCCFAAIRKIVDADLADYFRSIPHAELFEVGIAPDR